MKTLLAIIVILGLGIIHGCATFKASDSTETGVPNWKSATLVKERPNVARNKDCVYKVDETQKIYTVGNREACTEHIEIDVNSYKFTVVGIPVLMGGMKEQFQYRPTMPSQKIGSFASAPDRSPIAPSISDSPGPGTKFKSRDFSKSEDNGPAPGDQ